MQGETQIILDFNYVIYEDKLPKARARFHKLSFAIKLFKNMNEWNKYDSIKYKSDFSISHSKNYYSIGKCISEIRM